MRKEYLLLLFILVFAFAIRIYDVTEVPAGFFTDEVDIAYNAYTIFHSGVDEYGNKFPLYFRSFGDYKTPLYIYLMAPFVGFFGLEEFVVRFVSVMIGVLTVFFIYLLVKRYNEKVGVVSAALLAISPWHFHFSRIAFEAIMCPFMIVVGLYFLVRAEKEGLKLFIVSGVILGLGAYAYPVMKGWIPLFVLGWLIIKARQIRKSYVLVFLLIVIGLSLPSYLHKEASERFEMVSIFTQENPALLFIKNYISYLSPSFLIFDGDSNPRHSVSGFGQIYLVSALFLILGLIFLFKKWNKNSQLLLWLFFIFPITASLTLEGAHAIRSIVGLPIIPIIISFGIVGFVSLFKKWRKYIIVFILLAFLVNAGLFFYAYFNVYPSESAMYWYAGIKELFEETDMIVSEYEEVLLSDKVGYEGVNAYLNFYSNYPKKYNIQKNLFNSLEQYKTQLFIIQNSEAPSFHTEKVVKVNGKSVYKYFSAKELRGKLGK